MKFPPFELERIQSLYENSVEVNLTESGVEPLSLKELMNAEELEELINIPIGYGYTQGSPLLRQRISNLYKEYDEKNVLVTSGSSEAIFLSACLTVSQGDRVVMMTPNYLSFNGIAEALGAKVDYVPLVKKEKWGWELDLLSQVVTDKTKVISICNPNNPTGSILSEEEMKEIIEIADKVGAYILSDEIYIGAELSNLGTISFQHIYEKTIITSGLSKSYSHPGLRIGWIAADESVVTKAWEIKDSENVLKLDWNEATIKPSPNVIGAIQVAIENNNLNWYPNTNNIGLRNVEGKFAVVLNPDTLVDPNWLRELLKGYHKFGDGIYQPKFLTTDNHKILQSTGNMIQLFGFGFSRNKGELDEGKFNKPEVVGYASGTCLFTSSTIFQKLGMFDSFLFAYHDDLDLCWRAAMQDIKSYYIPSSIVYHPSEGFSFKWTDFKYYLLERNRQYCILTHYSRETYYKMLPALMIVEIAVFLFYLKKGVAISKIKATCNILKNLGYINKKYKKIQSERIIPDKKLIKTFEDEILIPKIMDSQKNDFFGSFIKNLSSFSRRFL